MEKNEIELIKWIESGMNYKEGIDLVLELSDKKINSNQFKGRETRLRGKLTYELCKIAKVANYSNWKNYIEKYDKKKIFNSVKKSGGKKKELTKRVVNRENEPAKSDLTRNNEADENSELYGEKNDQYPIIIKRIMEEMASLYQKRTKLHLKMGNMDASNSKQIIRERFLLFEEIKQISERFIVLYLTKQKYLEDKKVPLESDIYKEIGPEKKDDEIVSIEKIKLIKKNLQTSISKNKKKIEKLKNNGNEKGITKTNSARIEILESKNLERIKKIEEIDYQLIKIELDAGQS